MSEKLQPAFFPAPQARNPRSPPVPSGDAKGLAQAAFVQAPAAPSFQPPSQPEQAVCAPIEAQGSHHHPLTNDLSSGIRDNSPSQQESFAEIRHTRRQLWEATGFVLPIAGGSEVYKPKVSIPVFLAMWSEGRLDAQGEEWIAQNYPQLIENHLAMSEEEFSGWFLSWLLVGLDWKTGKDISHGGCRK